MQYPRFHELAHALGASSRRYGRDRAEILVECSTFIVCAGLGLATDGESVPYIAGWGEDGALEAVSEAAELIDQIAARIEQAVGLRGAGHAGESDRTEPT